MNLIKSKRRVADHGEVLTPRWLVEKMLDLVNGEPGVWTLGSWSLLVEAGVSLFPSFSASWRPWRRSTARQTLRGDITHCWRSCAPTELNVCQTILLSAAQMLDGCSADGGPAIQAEIDSVETMSWTLWELFISLTCLPHRSSHLR